jgi:hypothetical protein
MNIVVELHDVAAEEGRVRSYVSHTLREALGPHGPRFARAEVRLARRNGAVSCSLRLFAARADAVVRVEATAPRLHAAIERASWRAWDAIRSFARAGSLAA